MLFYFQTFFKLCQQLNQLWVLSHKKNRYITMMIYKIKDQMKLESKDIIIIIIIKRIIRQGMFLFFHRAWGKLEIKNISRFFLQKWSIIIIIGRIFNFLGGIKMKKEKKRKWREEKRNEDFWIYFYVIKIHFLLNWRK